MIPRSLLVCLALLCLAGPALAEGPPDPDAVGPAKVNLDGSIGTIDLPKGFIYYGPTKARKMLEENSGQSDASDIGIVLGTGEEDNFAILLSYDATGYVKDDEKLDSDAILKDLKEGTESANEVRREKGIEELHVKDWAEVPRYDPSKHQMIWAVRGYSNSGDLINFNTRLLGREGVLSENLLTEPPTLDRDKKQVAKVLSATTFAAGKRYEDYKAGDKVAEFGLMGLILGGLALGKGGILKAIIGFFLVFKKGAILLVVGAGAAVKKLFTRRS